VVGWDFSAERVESARARYGSLPNLSFAQKDLLAIGGEESRFDVIVCRYVLRHFKPADGRKALQNLFRALKPGGTLHCIDVDGVMGEVRPCSAFLKTALTRIRDAKAVNFQIAREMPALLMEQGFEQVDWRMMLCEFKGEELEQEIANLRQSVRNAEAFVRKAVGGAARLAQFEKEYFAALQSPGFVHCYHRVIAQGTKPRPRPKLVTPRE
jgi:ubiquinone/menaquinone biosynthesis C-methylase UbiE